MPEPLAEFQLPVDMDGKRVATGQPRASEIDLQIYEDDWSDDENAILGAIDGMPDRMPTQRHAPSPPPGPAAPK